MSFRSPYVLGISLNFIPGILQRSLVPCTHTRKLTNYCNSSFWESKSRWCLQAGTCRYMKHSNSSRLHVLNLNTNLDLNCQNTTKCIFVQNFYNVKIFTRIVLPLSILIFLFLLREREIPEYTCNQISLQMDYYSLHWQNNTYSCKPNWSHVCNQYPSIDLFPLYTL